MRGVLASASRGEPSFGLLVVCHTTARKRGKLPGLHEAVSSLPDGNGSPATTARQVTHYCIGFTPSGRPANSGQNRVICCNMLDVDQQSVILAQARIHPERQELTTEDTKSAKACWKEATIGRRPRAYRERVLSVILAQTRIHPERQE